MRQDEGIRRRLAMRPHGIKERLHAGMQLIDQWQKWLRWIFLGTRFDLPSEEGDLICGRIGRGTFDSVGRLARPFPVLVIDGPFQLFQIARYPVDKRGKNPLDELRVIKATTTEVGITEGGWHFGLFGLGHWFVDSRYQNTECRDAKGTIKLRV